MKSLGEEKLLSDTLGNQKNQFSTLVEILQQRASSEPAQVAYTYLANGETPEDRLTYQQLDCKAKAIAAHLQSCISPGDRALLIYPQGLEFIAAFFGCLYAGVVAIPAPAPEASRLKRIRPRLESIIQDAECSFILSTSKILSHLEPFITDYKNFKNLSYIATNTIDQNSEPNWQKNPIKSDNLAYLQYTSGSTSTPKGVAITHQNLIANIAAITQAHGYTSKSISASWIPYFHDYGLVNGMLQPLYAGIPCFIMSPVTFIKHPIRWLSAISKYDVTHTGAPCFAYQYCLEKINPDDCQNLNLNSWRVAHTGAETIRREILELFAEKFKPYGFKLSSFYPSYGLAEATLMVTTKKLDEIPKFCTVSRQSLSQSRVIIQEKNETENLVSLTSCGISAGDTKIEIVNPETQSKCGVDEVGEIWVAGSSVAKGYWQRLDLTEKTFQAYISDTKEGPFLRTGDLGFIKNNELFVTGRLKDAIIISGCNHYPEDIELSVQQSHPALRFGCGAAFAVETEGQERVIIVQEVNRSEQSQIDSKQITSTIRQAVSSFHEIQLYAVVLIKQGSIPKTSSGKIMRHACKVQFQEGTLEALFVDIRKK